MLKSRFPFLVDTGLRLNEAMSLNWGNVNLTEGSVFIERGKSKNARRTVPLTPRARKIVETLHEKRRSRLPAVIVLRQSPVPTSAG
jgi:integrase